MTLQSFAFDTRERDTPDGFGAYHDLYAHGSDVALTGTTFHARFEAYRFPRLVIFDRHMHDLVHSRSAARVRRDGFDHVCLHLLLAGSLSGGTPGTERHVAPGEILLFDTTRPQWTRASNAHVVSFSLARDQVEAVVPDVRALHGAVLPEASAGLLADLMASLARRGPTVRPEAALSAARAVTAFLASALNACGPPEPSDGAEEQLVLLRRERAEALIEARLANPDLDADRIAAGIGVSRSVLYRAFATDGGVASVVRLRRLERMRALLRRKGEARSISALAYACGFSSESHCNRAFRAAYGIPPGQFRADLHRTRLGLSASTGERSQLAAWLCELY